MSWRRAAQLIALAFGGLFGWFFGRMGWLSVPRADCDWTRDPHELVCSDNGPLYWALFAATIIATGSALWLLRTRPGRK